MSSCTRRTSKCRCRQRGLTLIEVLVAVLILGIGLLGIAGLQVRGMQFNHSAYLRSQASILAYDMLDRMRANRKQAEATASYARNFGESKPSAKECYKPDVSCSPADIAAFDLREWITLVESTLPDADGAISFAEVSGVRIYSVDIRWRDNRDTDVPYEHFLYKAEL